MFLLASQARYDLGAVAFWAVGIIAATLLVFWGMIVVRRWTNQEDDPSGPVWTLHDLTRLRDSGALTIQQYERLKSELIKEIGLTDGLGQQDRERALLPDETDGIADTDGPFGSSPG